MEDYRRIELNPAVNTVGLASVAVADSDLSDKARADQLREEFRRDSAAATASTPSPRQRAVALAAERRWVAGG